jgi:hypothetical protein
LCLSNDQIVRLKLEMCLIQFSEHFCRLFLDIISGSVLLHRQRSPEYLQQLLAWYKIRDTFFGENRFEQAIQNALELASICEHPNAVWLTKLFAGRGVLLVKRQDKFFFSVKTTQEIVVLLVVLLAILKRFVELLILAMRLRKQ